MGTFERALLIVNPSAHGVTRPLAAKVAARLALDVKLETVETSHRLHAIDLAREAAADGFDAVIAFSGDGTVNEAANAVAGTDVALGVLPGGATNVLCRHLGYPTSLPAATAELARRAREGKDRLLRLGSLNGRHFAVAGGAGIDAQFFSHIEAHPKLKSTFGSAYYFAAFFETLWRDFIRGSPVRFRVHVDGQDAPEAIFAAVCHGDPGAYFGRWGLRLTPDARFGESSDLTCFARVPTAHIPALIRSVFITGDHIQRPYVDYFRDVHEVVIEADREFPVQVDGDYLGRVREARIHVGETQLRVIA
jgi:diacylglycerol kinase family enzyme